MSRFVLTSLGLGRLTVFFWGSLQQIYLTLSRTLFFFFYSCIWVLLSFHNIAIYSNYLSNILRQTQFSFNKHILSDPSCRLDFSLLPCWFSASLRRTLRPTFGCHVHGCELDASILSLTLERSLLMCTRSLALPVSISIGASPPRCL